MAETLSRAGVVTITELRGGLEITTGSYVGRVIIGPIDLTIVPKVAPHRWLTLFGYAMRLRGLVRSEVGTVDVSQASQNDLLVLALISEARDLIARGLHREYVQRRDALASPRGRIDFQRLALLGGCHGTKVPCRYTRRSDDHPLNRVLLAGLQAAAGIASDPALRVGARRLAQALDHSVESVPLDVTRLREARAASDRRTVRYEPALQLIELLLAGTSVALGADDTEARVRIPGFAFDMNRLWQQLLGRVLTEWDPGAEVREEVALRDLFASDPAFPILRRNVPMPRPDFGVYQRGRLIAYLDAKYRDLSATSLPREMLYQLALYATAQGAGAAAMLYPTDVPNRAEERLLIRDPRSGVTRATVALRPVSLGRLEALINAEPSAARDRERSAFARLLCGLP